MKALFLFLLIAVNAQAQVYTGPKAKRPEPMTNPSGSYHMFGIAKIPKTCKHIRILYGAKTCRMFVRFPQELPRSPVFFTEDWTNKEDTTYHIRLWNPELTGMYVEGKLGHDIWWQVNSR